MSQYLDLLGLGGANAIAIDASLDQPRTEFTVPTDAIQSATPVDSSAGSAWGGFWRDTLGTLVNYGITRDAVRSGITGAQSVTPEQMQPSAPLATSTRQGNVLLMAALIAGAVFVAVKLAK